MPALRAVAYWRMSDDRQDKSIPQQRAEMLPRCQLERVRVAREFVDEGISGGGMSERDAFQAALAFCQECHKAGEPINAIVCYNASRFSRADSNETGHAIWEFRLVGVNRLLTWERWYDFRKEEDRAIFNLQQDFTSNRYLRDLSGNVLRGKKAVALAGYFTGGLVPYGFDRIVLDERGAEVRRLGRGEKLRLRGRGWHVILSPIPDDDPAPERQLERQTALWLWETFHREAPSVCWLARQLNGRGVPSPGGPRAALGLGLRKWVPRTIKDILRNPIYKGVARMGARGLGRYHRLVGGEIRPVEAGSPAANNSEGLVLTPLRDGGYVTPEFWDEVQAVLGERSERGLKPRRGDCILPAGLLYCAHCGHGMYGNHARIRRGEKVYDYRKYVCAGSRHHPGTCKSYAVGEDTIVGILKEQLLKVYLAPERLAGLEAALKARAEARHDRAPSELDRLKARLTALQEDIVLARRRALQAKDDATFAELNEGLRELLEQRKQLEQQLKAAAAQTAAPVEDFTGKVAEAMKRVRDLRRALEKAKGRKLGEAIRLVVSRAELYFGEERSGPKGGYPFLKAVLKLRPLLGVSGFSAQGCP